MALLVSFLTLVTLLISRPRCARLLRLKFLADFSSATAANKVWTGAGGKVSKLKPELHADNIVSQQEMSIFREVIVSAILSNKVYTVHVSYSGFRDRAILLYSSKIDDKKGILSTASITDIYCSSDEVATICLG
jgi:hypothetical protein